MKINIRVIIGLALIVAVAYLAYSAVAPVNASGTEVIVEVNTGYVTIQNNSDTPVQALMSGRTVFRVTVDGADEELTSARQGSGRAVTQVIEAELPPGDQTVRVSRGSDVQFTLTATDNIAVSAVPRNAGDANSAMMFAAAVILGLLFYISNATRHGWLRALRGRGAARASTQPAGA